MPRITYDDPEAEDTYSEGQKGNDMLRQRAEGSRYAADEKTSKRQQSYDSINNRDSNYRWMKQQTLRQYNSEGS